MIEPTGFVADGYERACEGIRAQVESEHAERLKTVSPEEADRLKLEMLREMEMRIRRMAPRQALY